MMRHFVRFSRQNLTERPSAVENAALDDRDFALLSALSEDSRMSFRDLAKRIHLSANATAERIQRLRAQGVIRRFSLDVSPAALGLHLQAFVDVKLRPGTNMDSFEKALSKMRGVREATSLTGAFDARLRVECRDPAQLGELVEQLRAQTGVQETSSTVTVVNSKYKHKRGGKRNGQQFATASIFVYRCTYVSSEVPPLRRSRPTNSFRREIHW